MRITTQTADKLVITTHTRTALLVIGALLVAAGAVTLALIRARPVTFQDLQPPSLLAQQQDDNPATDSEIEPISANEAGYQIANQVGHLLFGRERPIIGLAVIGLIVGVCILLGPFWGTKVTFDQAQQQVQLKQARWFFQATVDQHPFSELHEVRVERDRTAHRTGNNYGASLVFSHHEGAPLSRNYVHYKTVFPLSESCRYDHASAEAIVNSIRTFMADTQTA
ncbi:MAG: hypothetical protein H6631_18585 [Anaerolineaceae bacterium]|nr:hypothetical protein [Anaerolineaceae bacterium]